MSAMRDPARTRTVTWDDPMRGAVAGQTMSGLAYLRAMQAGELPLPPIMRLMGIELVEVEEGRVVFAVEPAEYHYNPIGSVHGGLASTILDSAMACSIHSLLPSGTGYTTLELKVNLVRPLTVRTGRVFCQGATIHVGRRVATAEGRLLDRNGKLYAHGTTTCLVLQHPPPEEEQKPSSSG